MYLGVGWPILLGTVDVDTISYETALLSLEIHFRLFLSSFIASGYIK